MRRCNQLHVLGFEKLQETVPKLVLKVEQRAFSKILRFLAFQPLTKLSSSREKQESLAYSISTSLK